MSRVPAILVALALQLPVVAQTPQVRPPQADGVVRLLSDLEAALTAGRLDGIRALAPRGLPEDNLAVASALFARGAIVAAAVRERVRQPAGAGFEVLVEVFVSYGRQGRVATWQIATEPNHAAPARFELTGISEVAAMDGLLRLTLDRSRQFTLHDFTLTAPDLTLKMPSGVAFVAESPAGITALVLMGDGEVTFAPTDKTEQGQLAILNGRPALTSKIETAYVRMSPQEFVAHLGSDHFVEARVDSRLARAQEIFDDLSPRTFNIDLPGLTSERWSLEPTPGNLVVEFRTGRFGWLTYALSPGDPEDVSLFDRTRNRNISVYASPASLAKRGRFYSDDETAPYDVQHYGVELTFDPERSFLSGRGSLRIKTRMRLAGTLGFRLAGSLTVSSVSSPEFGPLMALRVSGQNTVLISLPRPLERDTELVLNVTYSGRLEPQGLDREAIAPQGTTSQAQEPEPARLIPEARYLYSNRTAWYPQAPTADYAPARMRLSVPSEFQVVASGTLVNLALNKADASGARRTDSGLIRTAEYVSDRPLRYLACVISRFVPVGRTRVDVPALAPPFVLAALPTANPFEAATTSVPRDDARPNSVGLEVISTPRMASRNRQMTARIGTIFRYYATTIGEAPYPDFTLAAIDDNLPGGHSPAFFALLHQDLPTTPYSWSSDPVAFDAQYQPFFVAHEVAHQWWGQAVGWKNYHEQWLSEGLAQYFALLYAGVDRGPDVFRNLLGQMRESSLTSTRQGPIYLGYRLGHIQNDGRIFRALVYNKSAVVLHMLRALIGDDAFFNGLRGFYRDFRFQKAGTNDLRRAFETASGRSLERFFDRWIFGADIPRVRATWRTGKDGATELRVEQTGEIFDFPVTFAIQYADGTSEDVVVPVTQAVVEHILPAAKPIRRISVREELTLAEFR